MATNDSRHNFKLPRWASDTSGVASGNETEPPSQQKDDGWVPNVDSINGRWWNWLHQQAYYWFSYAENLWDRRWTVAHVMRSAAGTNAGEVTAGTGLAVDVVAARVWIDGAMYLVPAATDLALAAADPTDPRYDLVIARLNGGVPEYAVLTGTPAPAPVEPTPTTSQVPCARVRVNASASAPSSISDRRRFGVLEIDTLEASQDLDVGDDGDVVSIRANGGANPTVSLFGGTSGLASLDIGGILTWLVETGPLSLANLVGDLVIPPEQVLFSSAITRKFDISGVDFAAAVPIHTGFGVADGRVLAVDAAGSCAAPVRVPNGATITAIRVYGTKPGASNVTATLRRVIKATGVVSDLASADTSALGTGDFVISDTGLGLAVAQTGVLYLALTFSSNTDSVEVWGAEVEYTQLRPFDGL